MSNEYDENYFKEQYREYYKYQSYWKYFSEKIFKECLPDRALDAGCGFGFFVKELKSFNVESYGIDISEFAVKFAKRINKNSNNIILGNIEYMPFKDEIFDLIVSSEVLEHLKNPKKAIDDFKRILKNGGYIIITTPKPNSEYAKRDPTHISVYPENVWVTYFNGLQRYKHLEEVIRNTQAKFYSETEPVSTLGKLFSKFKYIRERAIKYYNDKNSIVLVFKKGVKSEVLFIHTPAFHYAHRIFAKAINADCLEVFFGEFGNSLKRGFLALKYGWRYPDYNYYILEGGMPLLPMFLKKNIKKSGKVIGLLADETVINFTHRLPYYSTLETLIHKISSKCLDGAIAVSPMIKEYARVLKIPVKIVRPCIEERLFEILGKVNPNLECKVVANVGYAKPSIGMDILVKAFEYLKDGELYVVGRGHPKDYEKVKGVKVLGWVENLANIFKKISLFVHPARSGACPVATLEAMRAGVPTIVSTMTGTKDVVQQVENEFKEEFGNYEGSKLVVIPSPAEVAKSIKWYFDLPLEAKEFLSKRFRKKSERFHPRIVGKDFKKAFENLREELK